MPWVSTHLTYILVLLRRKGKKCKDVKNGQKKKHNKKINARNQLIMRVCYFVVFPVFSILRIFEMLLYYLSPWNLYQVMGMIRPRYDMKVHIVDNRWERNTWYVVLCNVIKCGAVQNKAMHHRSRKVEYSTYLLIAYLIFGFQIRRSNNFK